jgi:hypothetical protein
VKLKDGVTGTLMTISDKYALSGNGNLVEKSKRETELHTAFFKIIISSGLCPEISVIGHENVRN